MPVPTGSLLPPRSLRLLPPELRPPAESDSSAPLQFVSNALFTNLDRIDTVSAIEPSLRDRILQSLPSDVGVQRYRENPLPLWSLQDELLLRNGLVYIPESLRVDVIEQHHNAPLIGHQGVAHTCELITRNFWFPRMQRVVENYINSCH